MSQIIQSVALNKEDMEYIIEEMESWEADNKQHEEENYDDEEVVEDENKEVDAGSQQLETVYEPSEDIQKMGLVVACEFYLINKTQLIGDKVDPESEIFKGYNNVATEDIEMFAFLLFDVRKFFEKKYFSEKFVQMCEPIIPK
jgi:hypothetical protein